MSLTGALNAAVTGLRAQSQGLGIISDNIANAATIGYKSTSSNFASLVTQAPTSTSYTPGGVLPHPFTNVAAQGILQSTNSNTDVGITGAGFFAVTKGIDSVSARATERSALPAREVLPSIRVVIWSMVLGNICSAIRSQIGFGGEFSLGSGDWFG